MALEMATPTGTRLELRCPQCKALILKYAPGRWGDVLITVEHKCRHCRAMFTADLHPERAVARLTAT